MDKSLEKPLWYFTSPSVRPSACLPSNSANRSPGILPMMLTSRFRRPRWAMPTTISCTPDSPAWLTTSSIEAMKLSPPSSEKRFWPTYLVCRKRSRPSDSVSCCRMWRFSSVENTGALKVDSRRCWIQRLAAGSEICMNSAPTERQYVSRSAFRMSRSVMVLAVVK
ncbi:Uncharacterised protein [Bordetella pertussis]|nr:Uncharacterised protein [Bordetella pertussis]CPL00640.1 Uncharacterised protein [Bordetella pertussis]CPM84140.1 Uncharacterised protein [Bordetella pertussis]